MQNTQLFQEATLPTTDPLFCVTGPILTCLANSAAVCLVCVYKLSKRGQVTKLLNVKTLKC
jgi:hypothetical protein